PFCCPGKIFDSIARLRILIMEEKEMAKNPEIVDTLHGTDLNTDENAAGTPDLQEPEVALSETEKWQAELQEQKDKYLRLMAEFDNFRRRTAKERLDLIQTAGKDVIVSLLDVLDDCDRAEKQLATSDDIALQKEGIQLVFNKLRTSLQQKGVKALDSIHTDFDVEKHEAITEIPAPTGKLKGKVLDEVVKGYYLNDKLIRFAKVVVGK
ncbi:MAG: nucleotide exchange factor GrpE, partial [Sediminibacterium sp.]|nr:nucleotide exchange factor GrpE [Sediminibacterium sp.]